MRIAIVGLGQIGSSLGAALTRRGHDVTGIVRRSEAIRPSLARKVARAVTTELDAIRTAHVVVLATPVRAIISRVRHVAGLLRPGAVLTDVGSTKERIMRAARGLPFVGGHPMAGSEKAGLDACDPDLFVGRPWFLVGRDPRVERMVRLVGAKAVHMRAREHDELVARVSHVPHLVAYALALTAEAADLALAGGSFRDATRVAASNTEMMLDVLVSNPRLQAAARTFARRVLELASAEPAKLRTSLEAARKRRARLQS